MSAMPDAAELLERIMLFVTMAGGGALLLWMARATASGKLGRNHLAGIRMPSTMATDEAWLAAHRRAERPTRWAGIVSIITGVVVLAPLPPWLVAIVILAGCLVMLAFVLYGAWVGSKAATATSPGTSR